MRLFLISIILLFGIHAYTQENNLSIGLQGNLPTSGLSMRYDFKNRTQIQVSYAFSRSLFSLSRDLYGGKYSYYFKKYKFVEPYTFAGLMLMKYNGYPEFDNSNIFYSNRTKLSYGLGGGIQTTFFKRVGISFELGFGKYNVNNLNEDYSFESGMGVHYFFRKRSNLK